MATMNISLPDELKAFAEAAVAEGRFSTVSDYVRDLIRTDEKRKRAIAEIQAALDEGEASGYTPFDPDELYLELIKAIPQDTA